MNSSEMIRSRAWPSLLPVALLLACAGFATAQGTVAGSSSASPEASKLPAVPVSAVEKSDNCERIAGLEAQLEDTSNGKNVRLIEGPEQTRPLGASGKFHLAVKNFRDPLNLAGIALDSAISTATSSSTSAFGTGWSGFGKRVGMSIADEGVSDFFSTFLISTLAHQDPHYHRDPDASTKRRIFYALSRVAIARSDSGKPMFNFAEVAGTAASSLVETTYHFERDESPGAVSRRIFVSLGSDAAWNLMSEFLPDIAAHVNPRWVFLRRLAEREAQQQR